MTITKLKKYVAPSLILVSFLSADVTEAQNMPVPENPTTSIPMLVDEPIILVESSSTLNGTPEVSPNGRINVDKEPGKALTAVQQERIINLAANISNRMDAAVERLANISTRLEQRIIKMEESGVDTKLAREKLVSANELLANAKLKLSDIDTLVNEATFSTKPQSNWQSVRERYQEGSSLIRQTHFALLESITFLKNLILRNQSATSSTGLNPNPEELIFN